MVKNQKTQELWVWSLGWGKIPNRRKWKPTPVFSPGKFHRWKSLAGYSPWHHKESDTTEHILMYSAYLILSSWLGIDFFSWFFYHLKFGCRPLSKQLWSSIPFPDSTATFWNVISALLLTFTNVFILREEKANANLHVELMKSNDHHSDDDGNVLEANISWVLRCDRHCSKSFTSPVHSIRDVLLFPSLLARTLVRGETKPLCLRGTELGEEARTSWPLGLRS